MLRNRWVFLIWLVILIPGDLAFAKKDQGKKNSKIFRKRPVLSTKGIEGTGQIMDEDSLDRSIQDLLALMDIGEESEKPKFLRKLAEIYWEKSEYYWSRAYGNELMHRLAQATAKGDKAAIDQVKQEQQKLLKQRHYWQRQAINEYKAIVAKYPTYAHLDQVLYYLGYTLVMMDKGDEAYQYFVRLIRDYPQSRFVPEALLNLGEYYFNQGKMQDALKLYEAVEKYKDSKAYGLAIYKKAWCYYNLGKQYYQQAMDQFLKVINYARSVSVQKLPYKDRLIAEAQRDMIMVYAQVGNPDKAEQFFKSIAPKRYQELLLRLAKGYASQGKYVQANRIYHILMTKKMAREKPYLIIKYQLLVVKNSFNQPKKSVIIRETRRLLRAIKKYGPSAPKKFFDKEMAQVDELLRGMIQTYDKEAQITKEKATLAFLVELEGTYMQLFPKSSFRGAVALRYANMLERLQKYELAADWFYTAWKMNPNDKHAMDSLHDAVMDYLRLIDLQAKGAKSEETPDLTPKKIPDLPAKAIRAAKAFIQASNGAGPDVDQIEYAAAKLLYDYNHFKEAIPLLKDMLKNHADSKYAVVSGQILLSSFHLLRDIDQLNGWAEKIAANPKLMKGQLVEIVTEIRNRAEYNKCYTFEKNKHYAQAGDCFLAYVRKFPNTKIKDRAMLDASTNYFRARMVLKALKTMAKLVNDMPNSKLAPAALFNIADFYRKIAIYSEAAKQFEAFVTNYPKNKLAEKALRYAMVFWFGMGEYRKSIRDSLLYLRKYPKNKKAPRVFLQVGLTMEKQRRWKPALRQFKMYLKKYGKSGGLDSYLRAYKEIGICYLKLRNQPRANKAFKATAEAYQKLTDDEKKKVGIEGLDSTAEAVFRMGEFVLAQVRRIKLRMPQKVLVKLIKKKLVLLKKAIGLFADVEKFGRPNWTIAAHQRRGLGFQELAISIEKAPVPRHLTSDQKMYYRDFLEQKAVPIWEQAKNEFLACVEAAKKLKWYNKYSEEAEKALRKIDSGFRSLPDIRARAGYFHLNSARPAFIAPTVETNPPSWTDADLTERLHKDAANGNPKALVNMGIYYIGTGDLKKAGDYINKARSKAQNCPGGIAAAAFIDLLKGHMDQALEGAKQALQMDNLNGLANDILAQSDFQKGDLANAMIAARKALITNPEDMNAYLLLAASYRRLKQLDVGILVCDNALGLVKKQPQILNMLGLIHIDRSDVKGAVHQIDLAVSAKPDYVDALMNVGAITLSYKDFTTAIAKFSKVVQLQPSNVMALLSLGTAYRGANQPAKALEAYKKVLQIQPGNLDVHFNLCVLYQENMSKYKEAAKECKTFMDRAGKGNPFYGEASQRYKGILETIDALKDVQATPKTPAKPQVKAPKRGQKIKNKGGKQTPKKHKPKKKVDKSMKAKKK